MTTTRDETSFFLSFCVILSNWNFCSMNILHMIAFYRKENNNGGGKREIHSKNGCKFIDSVTNLKQKLLRSTIFYVFELKLKF